MINDKIIGYIKKHSKIYKFAFQIYTHFFRLKKKSSIIRCVCNLLQNKKTMIFYNKSIIGYQQEHKIKLHILDKKMERVVFVPKNLPKRTKEKTEKIESNEIYYTELKNASIIGRSNVILVESNYLNDKFVLPYKNEFDFAVGPVIRHSTGKSCIEIDRNPKIIEKGIYLIGEASNNYYHWVFDILSRLLYFNNVKEYFDYPLLVDDTISKHPTCLELLNKVDLNKHKVKFLSNNKTYIVKQLIYISPTTWSSVYQSKDINSYSISRFIKPRYVIDEYKRFMIEPSDKTSFSSPKKIFITRTNDKVKRLLNEDQLRDIAIKYGFTPYEPGASTMSEQIKMFNGADIIVAASGAALVNLMWCHKGCKVVCVSPIVWNDYNYSTLAYLAGAECVYLDGNMIDNIRHTVDTDLFESVLRRLI